MIVYNNNSKLDLIICISEPDISYTKNKKLEVGKKYLGLYTKQPFGSSSNFVETYERYKSRGIEFIETPRQEAYGQVVVFKDKYGNKWDLIESTST